MLPTAGITEALQRVAKAQSDNLTLLQCEREELDGESRSVFSEIGVTSLSVEGPWQYFVRSANLTATLPAGYPLAGVGWPFVFSLNGLILLQHPAPSLNGSACGSSIGLIHRVGNQKTGQVVAHDDYDDLFRRVKRALKAAGARVPD